LRPPPESRRRHVPTQRLAVAVLAAPVLHDGALCLQLPAGRGRALAGGAADTPDRPRSLWRTGALGFSPQRHLHLPAALRPLPQVRTGAPAGRALHARPRAAPRLASTSPARRQRTAARLRRSTLRALPALPERPPRRRRHGSGQPRA